MTAGSVLAVPGRRGHRARPRSLPGVRRRLAAGRGRDGRHPLPARVRRADPLVGTAAGHRADRAHPAGRAGQHRVRPADRHPARAPAVAAHLPRARRRARRHHDPRALLRAARTVADTRPADQPAHAEHAPGRHRPQPPVPAARRRDGARHVHRVRGRGQPGPAAARTRPVHPASPPGRSGSAALGQVLGRLGYARLTAATSVRLRGVVILALTAIATALLAAAARPGRAADRRRHARRRRPRRVHPAAGHRHQRPLGRRPLRPAQRAAVRPGHVGHRARALGRRRPRPHLRRLPGRVRPPRRPGRARRPARCGQRPGPAHRSEKPS